MKSILFAYRTADGVLVDASSVPRGRDCGCICQSCSAPLIARQGEIRAWHFAHATNDSAADEVCEYSPFVSIRLMAHQILGDLKEISLPPASDESDTSPRNVSIDAIKVDLRFEETAVDAIAKIRGVPLVIYMTYKSRPIPSGLYMPITKKVGVLEINLVTILKLLENAETHRFEGSPVKSTSYTDMLVWLLAQDTSAKCWIYHPRQHENSIHQSKKSRSGVKLVSLEQLGIPTQPTSEKLTKSHTHATPTPTNDPLMARYVCQNCSETWIAGFTDENAKSCPICKQHNVSMLGLPR